MRLSKPPERLAQVINANNAFEVTPEQAAQIIEKMPNPYKTEGHKYLSVDTVPKIRDFSLSTSMAMRARWT